MQKPSRLLKLAATLALLAHSVAGHAAPIVHTSDFIADAGRTGFNGFENLTDWFAYGTSTHTEGGIKVERTGLTRGVWTVMGSNNRTGFEGVRAWYPEAVLNYPIVTGYDRITLASGAAFDSIGMLVGSGYGGYCRDDACDIAASFLSLHYELLFRGVSVASGVLTHHPNAHYLGFSGGGFDEVRLWDRNVNGWPDQNALIIDAIEVAASAVPEPGTPAMLLLGLGVLGMAARNRRSRS